MCRSDNAGIVVLVGSGRMSLASITQTDDDDCDRMTATDLEVAFSTM
jgi:hypothetical protein